MRSSIRLVKGSLGAAALAVALLVASPGRAAVNWVLKPNGTGDWDWQLYGERWKFTYATDSDGRKWSQWAGIFWEGAHSHCIELATLPGIQTSNPDTRIWVQTTASQKADGTPSTYTQYTRDGYTSVNDDFNGTYQSKVRVWLDMTPGRGSLEYYFKIAAYSTLHNAEDFRFSQTRLDVTETACTTGQTTIPWAKVIGTLSRYTVTLSSNAN